MTAGLKRNIAAMKATKQLPSFVQVLVTFEDAVAEIDRHMREKVELAGLVAKERDKIERLQQENEILRHDGLQYANEVAGRYYCASPEDATALADSMRRTFRPKLDGNDH
jgi:hypothetical protein